MKETRLSVRDLELTRGGKTERLLALNPYPTKPRITFKEDGTFKLTVFSDLHFGENPWDDWGPVQDINSLRLMRTVLSSEKPDFVYVSLMAYIALRVSDVIAVIRSVLNGDLITGESMLQFLSNSENMRLTSCHRYFQREFNHSD